MAGGSKEKYNLRNLKTRRMNTAFFIAVFLLSINLTVATEKLQCNLPRRALSVFILWMSYIIYILTTGYILITNFVSTTLNNNFNYQNSSIKI